MTVARRILLAALMAAPVAACAGGGSEPAAGPIRGTITKVVGSYLTIATTAGRSVTVAVPSEAVVSVVVPAHFADIKPFTYVGAAAIRQPDGTMRALEVHVFPDTMRGMGQGTHPWNLQPGSTMTAGIVSKVENGPPQRITMVWRGGEQTVTVPADVPVVTYQDGSASLLVPGTYVVVSAEPATDGVLRANRVVLGSNGTRPPM